MWRFLVVFFCILAACGRTPLKNEAAKPLALVSVAPYRTFVERIAGDWLEVKTVVPSGSDAHSFELTPREAEQLRRAKVWFRIGEPFEKRALTLLEQTPVRLVDLREGIELMEEEGLHCHHCGMDHLDRHIWMSPKLAKVQAAAIARALSEMYPERAEVFAANLAQLESDLDGLHAEIQAILAPVVDRTFLVSHPSFGYFCRDYDLTQLSVEFEGKDPRPQHLEEILEQARLGHAEVAFALPQYNNKGAQLIAEELRLPVRMVNPYSADYFETMRLFAHLIADPYEREKK